MIELNTTSQRTQIWHNSDDERTAGSMPVWNQQKTQKQHIEQQLTNIQRGENQPQSFAHALIEQNDKTSATQQNEFGFADLADIVNPLQHIPIVSHLYREISGDEIKSSSKLIGGTLYGGFIGAATGLANIVIEQETGKDMAGNALALVMNEKQAPKQTIDHPEKRLNIAAQSQYDDLPIALLAFTDTGLNSETLTKAIKPPPRQPIYNN